LLLSLWIRLWVAVDEDLLLGVVWVGVVIRFKWADTKLSQRPEPVDNIYSSLLAGKQTKFARQPNRTNVRAGVMKRYTPELRLPHSSRPRGRSPWQILADTFVR
jgi:hypothetical protein